LKTKKKTYLLLALVVTVWGTIAYKIIAALNPELIKTPQQSLALHSDFKVDIKVDTFSINIVNRDPFLGTLLKKTTKKRTKTIKTIQWQPISYQGTIKQNKTKEQIFIVTIKGTQHLLKKGQVRDSVTLVYGNTKSVTMSYKNQSKSFSLKKQ
jgi:hypothetical protein